jgi:hypothetical protein
MYLVDAGNTNGILTTGQPQTWTNFGGFGGGYWTALYDSTGSLSDGLTLTVTDDFVGPGSGGLQPASTFAGATSYPNSAYSDYLMGNWTNPTGALTVNGLDPEAAVYFTFYSSYSTSDTSTLSPNWETQITLDGQNSLIVMINSYLNQALVSTTVPVFADSEGRIVITVQAGPGNTASARDFPYFLNDFSFTVVPEPGVGWLLALALGGAFAGRRRRGSNPPRLGTEFP